MQVVGTREDSIYAERNNLNCRTFLKRQRACTEGHCPGAEKQLELEARSRATSQDSSVMAIQAGRGRKGNVPEAGILEEEFNSVGMSFRLFGT